MLAAMVLAITLSGYNAINQESAMEWMLQQPVFIDP